MDTNKHEALVHASSAVSRVFSQVSGMTQPSIWKEHKPMFFQLYLNENKSLPQVKEIAEKNYGFPQTPLSTYESKLRDELCLKKNLKSFEWIAISDHISRLGNPKVEVLLCGKLISEKKLRKWINRYAKKRGERSIATGASSLPEGVEIRPVSQEITMDDRQILAIGPAVPQLFVSDANLTMQSFSSDIQSSGSFHSSHKIGSNQIGNFSALDPPLVDNCFGSSEMSMEVAESSFFSTAKQVSHITSRLPDRLQMTFDFLTSRLTRNRSVTGILVVDPEFRKLWSSMLGHLPIMRAFIDPAASRPYCQDGDNSWLSHEDFLINTGDPPLLHYLSSSEHRHQRSTWSVQEIDQVTAPPLDAPLSTSRDVFHVINGVLYLFSNNPAQEEALECVRELVSQNTSWSTVGAILKIPSHTIQSTLVLLADCAFTLYARRLFDAVVSLASDHAKWLDQHGRRWLTQAAALGSAVLCCKLMKLGISADTAGDGDLRWESRSRHHYRLWTNTRERTQPSWYHQYRSHDTYYSHYTYRPSGRYLRKLEIELGPSPLVESVVRGHVETVDVLIEGGANFERRINGCTAVGHLLHSLFHNNVNLDSRLQILQKLLELGAKVDVPFYDAPRQGFSVDASRDSIADRSQDTISDMVWQTNCQEAIHLIQDYAKPCLGRPTVYGILRAAGNSAGELANLLQSFQASTSAERLSVESTALMKAIDKPEILLNMIKAGLDLHEPRELLYIDFGHNGLEYARIESFVPRNVILEKYLALIVEQPSHPVARHILQSIPPKAWLINPSTYVILGICRTSNSLNLLLQTGVQLQKPFLISAFAQAARENDHHFMTLLLSLLGNINYSLRTGPIHWNILILAAMAEPFVDRSSGLVLGHDPASIETLDWLIVHGASVSKCVETLNLVQDLRRSVAFDTQRLEWLLAHNIRPEGKSLCGIFMDYVSIDRQSVIPPELTISLFEPAKITDLPLFEPCNAMIDQSGQSVIKDFVLVYFIKVGAPTKFLQHLCDSGIDCNTPAKFCDSKQPLSWHFATCHHHIYCKCLTPLLAAISANRIDVVRYFIEKGANTNRGARYNALQFACHLKSPFEGDLEAEMSTKIEIVKCLLRNGAEPGRTGADSLPALRLAIKGFWQERIYSIVHRSLLEQHLQLLKILLDASVGTDGFEANLEDALRDISHLTISSDKHEAVTELLLGYKTVIDKRAWYQAPYGGSLMAACHESDIDRIKTLLDRGVTPNWFKSPEMFGPSIFHPDRLFPSTPSAVLAAQGNIPLLLLLRAAGAELGRHDNSLECAASAGRLDTVAWLLQFEEREEAFARALMHAHLKKRTTIQTLIEEHLRSIGSDLLDHGNWKHPLYYSSTSCYAGRIQASDLVNHPVSSSELLELELEDA